MAVPSWRGLDFASTSTNTFSGGLTSSSTTSKPPNKTAEWFKNPLHWVFLVGAIGVLVFVIILVSKGSKIFKTFGQIFEDAGKDADYALQAGGYMVGQVSCCLTGAKDLDCAEDKQQKQQCMTQGECCKNLLPLWIIGGLALVGFLGWKGYKMKQAGNRNAELKRIYDSAAEPQKKIVKTSVKKNVAAEEAAVAQKQEDQARAEGHAEEERQAQEKKQKAQAQEADAAAEFQTVQDDLAAVRDAAAREGKAKEAQEAQDEIDKNDETDHEVDGLMMPHE